jgi:hypothetical protein
MDNALAGRLARQQFLAARRRATFSGWLARFRGRPNQMLPLEEVRRRMSIRGQRHLGLQTVPIDHIIGSEGRYTDFDRRFLPLNEAVKQRWTGVGKAWLQDIELPPIDLYKIGEIYFVRDGNHRVSVARQYGQDYIDAIVTEIVVDVPLSPDLSVHDLLLKEEYSDFLEWTDLARLRPEQQIEFTELGGYLTLIQHINGHRYFLGMNYNREFTQAEAVESWYDTVYLSIIEIIRAQQSLQAFPKRTEADLYRWIMEHRWYLRECMGDDPGPSVAASSYTEQFGHRSWLATIMAWLFQNQSAQA